MNDKIYIVSAYEKKFPYNFIEDCYASNSYSECVFAVGLLSDNNSDVDFRIHLLFSGVLK